MAQVHPSTPHRGAPSARKVAAATPIRQLQASMTSKAVLRWIGLTWTAEELKRMLEAARQCEPALRRLAHKNANRTREPAELSVAQKHLLGNAFAAALFMMARGGPNDGDEYYAPLLALRFHEDAARMRDVPAIARAIERWQGLPFVSKVADARESGIETSASGNGVATLGAKQAAMLKELWGGKGSL